MTNNKDTVPQEQSHSKKIKPNFKKHTSDLILTAKHEIKHAIMASLLGCDVYQIILSDPKDIKSKYDDKGACYHSSPKSNLDMVFIAIAPYCHEKNFTFQNLIKYGKANSDITNYMSYFTLLTEKEFEAHKTIVLACLKEYHELIKEASNLLVKNKIIHWQEWKDLFNLHAVGSGE